MLCDFTNGVDLVSGRDLIPWNWSLPLGPASGEKPYDTDMGYAEERFARRAALGNLPLTAPPRGWKGSLPSYSLIDFESVQVGNWHNFAPGLNGVELDLSRAVSLFDPKYDSLVRARRMMKRDEYRAGSLSKSDARAWRRDIEAALSREESTGSGIQWQRLAHLIVDRHGGRIDYLSLILQDASTILEDGSLKVNTTESIKRTRNALFIILGPFLTTSAVPSNTSDTASLTETIHYCSTLYTARLGSSLLTPQERLFKRSIEGVMKEICRTIGLMWLDAFPAEDLQEEHAKRELLAKLNSQIQELKEHLGWATWVRCHPPCGPYVRIFLPCQTM